MATRTKTQAPRHTTFLVRNQSARLGPVRAVALHSTESQDIPGSSRDLVAIRNWFNNPASQASAHVGVDGDGKSEQWVKSNRKAWTIGAANTQTLNIEFVARAAQSRIDWEANQLRMGARWAAYWGHHYNIPMRRGVVKKVGGLCVVTTKGIITHYDVTKAGFGSHTDPGPNFPMERFLELCRYYYNYGWTV